MQKDKRGKEIKSIPGRRVCVSLLKLLIYGVLFCVTMIIFYVAIAYAIVCLTTQQFYNPCSKEVWECMKCLYLKYDFDYGEAIPDIIIAAVSLLLTVAAMYQAHHAASRSRALEFPHNYLKEICIVPSVRGVFSVAQGRFRPSKNSRLLILIFKDGFPTYYSGIPYRLFAKMRNSASGKEEEDWQQLEIVNYYAYNHLDKNDTSCYILMLEIGRDDEVDGTADDLMNRYCNSSSGNTDIKLNFILDMEWTNHLVGVFYKPFYKLYLRKEFELDRACKNDVGILDEDIVGTNEKQYVYRIMDAMDSLAPFFSIDAKNKCGKRKRSIQRHFRERSRNNSTLEKRKKS